jgi:2-polyprenyl-3-methyl-5-hydroxy-6-metoxy-1,4-benzoquinol methylase
MINEHFLTRKMLSAAETAALARALYADVPGTIRYKQGLRPYICPFHILVDVIPPNCTILDVGCGAGLFIALLAYLGRVRSAVGFDTDRVAILAAESIASRLSNSSQICFEHRNAHAPWPEGRFDVVCLIDILHHVRPGKQVGLISTAAEHVAEGGMLLYKDMVRRPFWRAWANRVHDLLSVREWIYYPKINDVIAWAEAEDLHLEKRGSINMLWYGHEWLIFRRKSVEKEGGSNVLQNPNSKSK